MLERELQEEFSMGENRRPPIAEDKSLVVTLFEPDYVAWGLAPVTLNHIDQAARDPGRTRSRYL